MSKVFSFEVVILLFSSTPPNTYSSKGTTVLKTVKYPGSQSKARKSFFSTKTREWMTLYWPSSLCFGFTVQPSLNNTAFQCPFNSNNKEEVLKKYTDYNWGEKKFIRQSKQDKWITMVTLSARLTVLCKDTLNGLLLMTESSIDFLVH